MKIDMQSKEITPEEDIERMSNNLWTNYGESIKNYGSYEKAYKEYFVTDLVPKLRKKQIKSEVWDYIVARHSDQLQSTAKKSLNKKGSGKNLALDKQILAKKVVVSPKEYVKLGASNVDLAGYDTPTAFAFLGKQKTKTSTRQVYARVINTKTGIRFIDRKGRFVKIKK